MVTPAITRARLSYADSLLPRVLAALAPIVARAPALRHVHVSFPDAALWFGWSGGVPAQISKMLQRPGVPPTLSSLTVEVSA